MTSPLMRMHAKRTVESYLGERRFPRKPSVAGSARTFIRDLLTDWDAPDSVETAELLVSELVGNAIRYGGGALFDHIHLVATRVGPNLYVDVHDGNPELPEPREIDDPMAVSGRGLFLVRSLAVDYGAYTTANGKSVWFTLAAWPSETRA
ncbi:ATP-binding protein [Thermopolyspora sp. NPDC052614]|uniref:ATP-binding protein n=1 Tax=Thermopolyspora sp. NPDC052614 TaxID=3155682 RepID=UPI003444E398